jgi:AcrR family transcriptional regulator
MDRQSQFVSSARQLFEQKGYAEVGMREIATHAGFSPVQAYRIGLSKIDLLAEISIALSDEQINKITKKFQRKPDENVSAFVQRYLLTLYASDIKHIKIRRESAAFGWMWSAAYEERIRDQVMALLAPIIEALTHQGHTNVPACCMAIWSLYYVGYRNAVVSGATATQCLESISPSLELLLPVQQNEKSPK